MRGAFIFTKTLYLFTSDWLIYEVPNVNFQHNFGKMLFNITPMKIEEKWPLFKHERFQKMKAENHLVSIYSTNIVKPFMYFDGVFDVRFPLD